MDISQLSDQVSYFLSKNKTELTVALVSSLTYGLLKHYWGAKENPKEDAICKYL
jgi:hypothetical protein